MRGLDYPLLRRHYTDLVLLMQFRQASRSISHGVPSTGLAVRPSYTGNSTASCIMVNECHLYKCG